MVHKAITCALSAEVAKLRGKTKVSQYFCITLSTLCMGMSQTIFIVPVPMKSSSHLLTPATRHLKCHPALAFIV